MSAGAPLGRTSSPLLPELVIGSSARYVDEVSPFAAIDSAHRCLLNRGAPT